MPGTLQAFITSIEPISPPSETVKNLEPLVVEAPGYCPPGLPAVRLEIQRHRLATWVLYTVLSIKTQKTRSLEARMTGPFLGLFFQHLARLSVTDLRDLQTLRLADMDGAAAGVAV